MSTNRPVNTVAKFFTYFGKVVIWLLLLLWCCLLYACSGGDQGAIPLSQWPLLQVILFMASVAVCVGLLIHLVRLAKQRLSYLYAQKHRFALVSYLLLLALALVATIAILVELLASLAD